MRDFNEFDVVDEMIGFCWSICQTTRLLKGYGMSLSQKPKLINMPFALLAGISTCHLGFLGRRSDPRGSKMWGKNMHVTESDKYRHDFWIIML